MQAFSCEKCHQWTVNSGKYTKLTTAQQWANHTSHDLRRNKHSPSTDDTEQNRNSDMGQRYNHSVKPRAHSCDTLRQLSGWRTHDLSSNTTNQAAQPSPYSGISHFMCSHSLAALWGLVQKSSAEATALMNLSCCCLRWKESLRGKCWTATVWALQHDINLKSKHCSFHRNMKS